MASTRPSAQRRAPRSKERTSPCLLPASGLPGSTGVVIRAFLKSLRIIPCHLLADYSETVPMFIDEARTRDRVSSRQRASGATSFSDAAGETFRTLFRSFAKRFGLTLHYQCRDPAQAGICRGDYPVSLHHPPPRSSSRRSSITWLGSKPASWR